MTGENKGETRPLTKTQRHSERLQGGKNHRGPKRRKSVPKLQTTTQAPVGEERGEGGVSEAGRHVGLPQPHQRNRRAGASG